MTDSNSTQKQKPLASSDSEETQQNPTGEELRKTGFFNRVRQELNPEQIHPSEAAEIVVDPDTLESP
jgi:hypothetical protein